MSLDASVLLIGVMLIRLLFMNKIPKITLLILWGIVALKLIVPYSFYSKLNFLPLIQSLFSNITNTQGSDLIKEVIKVPQESNTVYSHFSLAIQSDFVLSIWFIGAITILVFFIILYVRTYKEFQTAIPVKDNSYLNEWLRKNTLKRTVQISVSDRITTPCTYKLFKPVIIFPKSFDWNDEKNLQFVLAHEYVHIKRWDVLWKVILTVIVALHWFNPLVWVMYYIVNRDIELSCDEKVIRQFGDETKSEYALSLINMAEKSQKMTSLCNNFSKNGIEERIVSIMKLKKTSILGVALASTLVVGGITIFATTGQASEAPKIEINQLDGNKVSKQEKNGQSEVVINDKEVNLVRNSQRKVEINGKEVKNNVDTIVLKKTDEGIEIEGERFIYKDK
ncbi:M56 family metallopeptidase [Paenibacillus sp. EC2-1]|uniref:M56 family metallopeptidase n=1 Tax=Paenibacillus sp. EC2-1 TaxID=3388665 RepID=UPI003BEECC22